VTLIDISVLVSMREIIMPGPGSGQMILLIEAAIAI